MVLQERHQSIYSGSPTWEDVTSVRVRGRSTLSFTPVANDENTETYRVLVAYPGARTIVSRPLTTTVWRWIPLSDYAPYYDTGGTLFRTTTINGRTYNGWGAAYYSHVGSWEARFTPGRNCTDFRGVFGVADLSGDGSSGRITVTADDQVVHSSPVLTPGSAVPVQVPLALSYRMGIQLQDLTPADTPPVGGKAVEAWPVIGEPALRCTGV